MGFLEDLFGSSDHEDGTRHEWTKWTPIVLNVKRHCRVTGNLLQGQQDAQKRVCKSCGKTQVEDI